jgi:hypothetical protein
MKCAIFLKGIFMGKRSSNYIYYDRKYSAFVNLTPEIIQRLKDTYPGVDVEHELNKMTLWLESSVGIKRVGNINFISSWLNRAYRQIPVSIKEKQEPSNISKAFKKFESHLDKVWANFDEVFSL